MATTELAKHGIEEKGLVLRDSFGISEKANSAETAIAAVQAREAARINGAYVMAERHPRSWDDVRVRLLQHCDRPGFAEVAWYRKPAGKAQINGQWVNVFAEGLSARFAEVARQEMGNVQTETTIVFEDHMARIIRATSIDLERNTIDSREFTIPKFVEKRGTKEKDGSFTPPKGREVISQRFNTYGEPTYLVVATDDEVRMKMNSEISKTTRDESLRLIPKDIRDDCAKKIAATKADPKKTDPLQARKNVIDNFAALNVMPSDLQTYMQTDVDKLSPAQVEELRGLYVAIRDGDTTFNEALKAKYDTTPHEETEAERDIRLQRQMKEQEKPKESTEKAPPNARVEQTGGATNSSGEPPALSANENAKLDKEIAEADATGKTKTFKFGGKK